MKQLPSGDGGQIDQRKHSFQLIPWLMAYGLGVWLGNLYGLHHQTAGLDIPSFWNSVSTIGRAGLLLSVAVTILWFTAICLIGHAPGGRWLLLCLTVLQSASSGYVLSVLLYLQRLGDTSPWIASQLVYTLFFWTGTYGLMDKSTKGNSQRLSLFLCLGYFILCSLTKMWYLQSL